MKKILVFTGAGVSKESGIDTFRDSGGIWDRYDVNVVAHINGWRNNPQDVLDFHNLHRYELLDSKPNKAHYLIAELETQFNVMVVTQNIDSLHEKAGSKNVIHLHGEASKMRSEKNPDIVVDCNGPIKLGDLASDGSQLRPDVVWFGEDLDSKKISLVRDFAKDVDVCIIVGTSMQVSPANEIPFFTPETSLLYYVDPGDIDFFIPKFRKFFLTHIQEVATSGMQIVSDELIDIFK